MTSQRITVGPRTLQEMAAFEQEINAVKAEVRQRVGDKDARYIRTILWTVRILEISGRGLLMLGWFPPTWLLGTFLLGISKIIDNMELGHNVMHGQFNFMNDPRFNGDTFEWDNTCPKEGWRQTHNFVHHTYTNVIGKDRDFGYGMLRLSSDLRWSKFYHPFQSLYMLLMVVYFEWFVALHEMQTDKLFTGRLAFADMRHEWDNIKRKVKRQFLKDYVWLPLLAAVVALPFGASVDVALAVLAGNFLGNIIRNVWAWAIIFCGHVTAEIYTFDRKTIEGETQGQWYLRQILGSSNIKGSKLMHIMSGNLSHQIEHHLFPDLPANRYAEVAPQIQAICRKYNVPYNMGRFLPQLATVMKRVLRYSLPGGPQKAMSMTLEPLSTEKA